MFIEAGLVGVGRSLVDWSCVNFAMFVKEGLMEVGRLHDCTNSYLLRSVVLIKQCRVKSTAAH